ncbi:hypothetical protein NQ318_013615 [Aromia moschata]|uniref:Cyclin N-terminal domain-containing protein n=1 Tax=Aromia moschata TaxID=1265417 RepID=A0AAV8YKA5_9CUCU|nr:hypothetical protein NQ318_013615 [Aromia moschata]
MTKAWKASVVKLRLLRVWFDMPHAVFFTAVTYLDLFLSRIKLQEKYFDCLALACFHWALLKNGYNINVTQLVKISQVECSVRDVLRMANIVKEKLNLRINEDDENDRIATCGDFLTIFLEVLEYVSTNWTFRLHSSKILETEKLMTRLEVLMTNTYCVCFRASALALVLLKLELEKFLPQAVSSTYYGGELLQFLGIIHELQIICGISNMDLVNCSNNASNILWEYDNQSRIKQAQNAARDKGNRYRSGGSTPSRRKTKKIPREKSMYLKFITK